MISHRASKMRSDGFIWGKATPDWHHRWFNDPDHTAKEGYFLEILRCLPLPTATSHDLYLPIFVFVIISVLCGPHLSLSQFDRRGQWGPLFVFFMSANFRFPQVTKQVWSLEEAPCSNKCCIWRHMGLYPSVLVTGLHRYLASWAGVLYKGFFLFSKFLYILHSVITVLS